MLTVAQQYIGDKNTSLCFVLAIIGGVLLIAYIHTRGKN